MRECVYIAISHALTHCAISWSADECKLELKRHSGVMSWRKMASSCNKKMEILSQISSVLVLKCPTGRLRNINE